MNRIEAVAWRGHGFIEWWELNSWYNAERISKSIWRDLRDRFDEIADDSTAELMFSETGNGIMLIHSKNLKKVNDKIGGVD